MQKTTHTKLEDAKKSEKWYLINADGKIVGDLATTIATIIRGKNKPLFHPSIACGDQVVVINAEKVVLTGNKETQKTYVHYTGFPGGLRTTTPEKLRKENPEKILELAVKGMVPRNRLRKHVLAKLHVYAGTEHPHGPQNPQPLTLA
ncbi:50S ribosomal protein L13 [Candidatus Peregrinibacteria bacterium]|nr:MAG: 50S ribosomal protein L13 [Candidatus Peregrinibacteria bacterium]